MYKAIAIYKPELNLYNQLYYCPNDYKLLLMYKAIFSFVRYTTVNNAAVNDPTLGSRLTDSDLPPPRLNINTLAARASISTV